MLKLSSRPRFGIKAQRSAIRCKDIPTSIASAPAQRPFKRQRNVFKAPSHPSLSTQQPAVRKDSGLDAFGDVDDDKIAPTITGAKPDFRQGTGARNTFH